MGDLITMHTFSQSPLRFTCASNTAVIVNKYICVFAGISKKTAIKVLHKKTQKQKILKRLTKTKHKQQSESDLTLVNVSIGL